MRITPAARIKVDARPAVCDVLFATSPKTRLKPPSRAVAPVFTGLDFSPAIEMPSFYFERAENWKSLGRREFDRNK
jgi:hypothetical protein